MCLPFVTAGKTEKGVSGYIGNNVEIICRDCDSKIFQEYETPENCHTDIPPTQKILAQIAMKNYLKFISKRKMEIALLEKILEQRL